MTRDAPTKTNRLRRAERRRGSGVEAGARPPGRAKQPTASGSRSAPSADYVRDVILKELDRQTGQEGAWEVEGPLVEARVSRIFRARTRLARTPLAVKVFSAAIRPEQVAAQAALLRRCRDGMSIYPGLTVPALWGVLPEHRSLVMEWLAEPQVSRLLTEAGRNRERRASLFGAAGRWLRAYHDQSGIVMLPLSVEAIRREIDAMVRGADGARTEKPSRSFRAAYQLLLDCAGAFKGVAAAHAIPHGDYNGNNLFHGPERTIGIDLAVSGKAPVAHDICRFLVQCETTKPFLTRKATLSSLGVEQRDLAAFLDAYDPRRELLDDRVFAFLHFAEILRRWGTLFGRPKGRFHLVRRMKHFRLARMAQYAGATVESVRG